MTINSSKSNIGEVSINPIIEKIEINDSYRSVELEFAYPNGKKQTDERANVLKLAKQTKANDMKITLKFDRLDKSSKLSSEGITDVIQPAAERGYLKSAMSGGKNIIESTPIIVHRHFKEIGDGEGH
ncbi:hypothetical protein [Schleiferilactobacillus perolens]|jgi:hypothetical protein|uniref:hypothetical protein n=1 Tax=Schleiferilactobacillus perolens TaxID=100468 RepID=UPI00235775E7|nr:hypothetical protein [Schleiferilactobacillus perolens]MCI2172543.1 hypothetical protein [Schleiferilactobacillus perolens]